MDNSGSVGGCSACAAKKSPCSMAQCEQGGSPQPAPVKKPTAPAPSALKAPVANKAPGTAQANDDDSSSSSSSTDEAVPAAPKTATPLKAPVAPQTPVNKAATGAQKPATAVAP